jgi:hypothetical protein
VRRMRRSVAGFDFKEEHSHFDHARQCTPRWEKEVSRSGLDLSPIIGVVSQR